MIVKDNGVGIPANLNPLEVKSVGMQLVRELAVQLRATLEIERDDWTAFKLEFSSEV